MTETLRQEFRIAPDPVEPAARPQVFARAIVTPPAPPWEQARAANLEAQHGAPLPLAELLHRVKRLSSWGPGRPGRFAVLYVRAKEVRHPFEATADVEGQTVKVSFGAGGERVRRVQGGALVLLLLVAIGAVLGTSAALAIGARTRVEARLETAEKLGASKLAAATAYRNQVLQAHDLRSALGRGRPIADLVEDLAWVATAKTPEARLAAVHWQGGVMAVEVRGDQPPFAVADRQLERAPHPLRPGVWLWGVGSASGASGRAPATPRARP